MIASREGHAPAVAYLLEKGADVDEQDNYKWTALTWAVKKSQVEVAKALVAKGANVNHQDSEGTPLLQLAVDTNSPEMVRLLLDNKADVKAPRHHRLPIERLRLPKAHRG